MRVLVSAACLATAVAAVAFPAPAHANPSSAWRTRVTGLESEGQCTRRAFNAMKAANLNSKASGTLGVYGSNNEIASYVICTNNGSLAVIFCASDRPNSANSTAQVCDTVSRFMDR